MKRHELYDKFLSDSLTNKEENELVTSLEDKDNADKFANYVIETNMMVSVAQNIEAVQSPPKKKKKKKTSFYYLALAASILIGILVLNIPEPISFKVVNSTDKRFEPGTEITDTIFNLESTTVHLEMSNGTQLEMKGPIQLSVKSIEEIVLSSGSLNVRLAADVKRFKVITQHGSVKDLGTAFGLEVTPQYSNIHVYDGEVEIKTVASRQKITEGHAVKFNSDQIKKSKFFANILKRNKLEMGHRELRPGQQMDLILDKAGTALTANISLSFQKDKKLKYKLIAYSKGKKVYETESHTATDSYEIEIPALNHKDLTLEMKIEKGYVHNGVLNIKNLTLVTEGEIPYEGSVLVSANSTWYYQYKQPPPLKWMKNEFNVEHWTSGQATLGYGDYDLKTKIGDDSLRKTISRIFLRKEFNIADLELNSLTKLKLSLLADDGAVVYVNGREITRYNLPEGAINDTTRAVKRAARHSGEMIYKNFTAPADCLITGKNVITVILYQINSKSSDMRFDLQMNVF